MNLKWLFGTAILATIVFFGVVYFGMKYNWVGSSTPTAANKINIKLKAKDNSQSKITSASKLVKNSESPRNVAGPELIDEEAMDNSEGINTLGSSELTIDEIVSQCQRMSQSIGVPELKIEQAVIECVDRNSRHLTTQKPEGGRDTLVREQCNIAIAQNDLLSTEEIKMLVDECVASMTPR